MRLRRANSSSGPPSDASTMFTATGTSSVRVRRWPRMLPPGDPLFQTTSGHRRCSGGHRPATAVTVLFSPCQVRSQAHQLGNESNSSRARRRQAALMEWGRQEWHPTGQRGGRSFLNAPLVSAHACGFLIFSKSSIESFCAAAFCSKVIFCSRISRNLMASESLFTAARLNQA